MVEELRQITGRIARGGERRRMAPRKQDVPTAEAELKAPDRPRLVDSDIHNDYPSPQELKPFLDRRWHPWLEGGYGFPSRAYGGTGSGGNMTDVVNPSDGRCAGDPEWVVERLMRPYEIDVGVLSGTMMRGVGILHNGRFAAAIARAYNDWTIARWLEGHPCFRGSVVVTPQNVPAAVAEIHRLADDPRMAQVMMTSAARTPYGNPMYWPIYEAAAQHDIPVALHVGEEGVGIGSPPTGVGYPSYYFEYHTDLGLTMMAHCVSLVVEGVFEEFPSLRFLFVEGGVCWLPHLMWRLDRLYPALRAETPYLRRKPSEYILSSCYFSTQPIEEPDDHRQLLQMLSMLHAEKTVVFASDYPHWDFDNHKLAFSFFPQDLKRRIFVDNALELYGDRVLPDRGERR